MPAWLDITLDKKIPAGAETIEQNHDLLTWHRNRVFAMGGIGQGLDLRETYRAEINEALWLLIIAKPRLVTGQPAFREHYVKCCIRSQHFHARPNGAPLRANAEA